MPRVIVFDLIGTLLDLQTMDGHFDRFFGDAAVRKEWFAQTLQLAMASVITNSYEDFGVQADTGLEITARRYKVSLLGEEKNLILGTVRKLRAFSDVAKNLQRLRDAGFRLAALTNSTAEAAEAQLTQAGLREHFEQVISADEAQCFKPASEVYQLTAKKLDLGPEQLRMVSAHDWDVSGALRAGYAATFLSRPGQVMNPFGPQPDTKATDFSDAVDKILAIELEQG